MVDQEIDRDRAVQSCQRLKTMVRRHVDQMIRSRIFRARNERIETGVVVKSYRERKIIVERKVGERRPLQSSLGKQAQSSFPAPKAQTQIDQRRPSKGIGHKGESPSGRRGQKACTNFFKGSCPNSSCYYRHPPVCQNYSLYRDDILATHVCLDTLRLMGNPVKSRRKVVENDHMPYWMSPYTKFGKLGSNRADSGKKGPSQRIMQKCETQERNPCAPKFEDRTLQETLQQEWCARRESWDLAKHVHKLQARDKASFYSPADAEVMLAHSSKKPEEQEFVVDSGASAHMLSKKDSSSAELETLRKSRNHTMAITVNGEVQPNEEAQVYVHDFELFVTVQILDDTPGVLSSGKLSEEHGYTCEWAAGQKPHLTKSGKRILLNIENYLPVVVQRLSSARPKVRLPYRSRKTHRLPLQVQQHNAVTIPTLKHRVTEAIPRKSKTN